MMSPEDTEFNRRCILMNASRRSTKIFEIISTKERRERSVASKVRLEQRQRPREEMGYEGTPVKAPPNIRRRVMPPTPTAEFAFVY